MDIRKIFRFGYGNIVGAVLTVAVGFVLLFTQLGKGLVNASYNVLFAPRPHVTADELVIVYLDDVSHENLKQSYVEPWDRDYYVRLLKRLKEDGAKAVVFDVVFSDAMTNNPVRDERLAKAIKENGKVILGADYVPTGEAEALTRKVNPPLEAFMDGAASIGIVEMMPDDDFIVRGLFPGERGDLVSSLGWTAAEFLGAQVTTGKDDQEKEKKKFQERWINYYGPPRHLSGVSFFKAISDEPGVRTEPGFFRDKVVYVGAHVITWLQGERKDEYRTPYSFWLTSEKNLFMPGAEIQATIFLNLLRGDWLTRLPRHYEGWISIVAGLIFGIGLVQLRPVWASITALASIALVGVCAYFAFTHYRVWTPWLVLAAGQIPIATIWSVTFNSINLYVSKRLMEQSLSMYVSPARVKQIAKNPKILKPGAEKQEVSILFSDIANFTSMSEGMDSDQLAHLMNNYFETTVGQCIHPAQGTVVKFIGDAIFAIWNAPEPQVNHKELACRGALLLRDSTSAFKFDKPGLEVRTRIGLHSGPANVGNFGSSTRIDYTALGENINLASRMEGLNKYLGTDVLITEEIYSGVKEKFITRFAGRFQLKGFEKVVGVHELLGSTEQAEASRPWREAYAAALQSFEKKDFEAAERGFHCVLELRPNDGPAKFFLKHLKALHANPPEGEWEGTIELAEK